MRIVLHHSKFYDWVPVPADVKVTEADKTAGRVRPGANGGWLMKVTKDAPGGMTHTLVNLPETQVVAKIIDEKTRLSGGRTLTRKQAVEFYLREHVLPGHSHQSWLSKVEVHDDGPVGAIMKAALEMHGAAVHGHTGMPNVHPDDHAEHMRAYLEPADHAAHLSGAFKVKGASK